MNLKASKTHENLALFRSRAEETHAHEHLEGLAQRGDPAAGRDARMHRHVSGHGEARSACGLAP